jgi:hypothetical protein
MTIALPGPASGYNSHVIHVQHAEGYISSCNLLYKNRFLQSLKHKPFFITKQMLQKNNI